MSGWNPRFAKVLVETSNPVVRAALVDSNGDGQELWFGLDVRSPSGEWIRAIDLDDVGGHQPVQRLEGTSVVYSWGTGRPRERRQIEFEGAGIPIHVERNGWWLVAATIATT